MYVEGLEAGLKHGGQQAIAKECIFKTCTLQGFSNISFFFCLDRITIIFPVSAQDQLITMVSVRN